MGKFILQLWKIETRGHRTNTRRFLIDNNVLLQASQPFKTHNWPAAHVKHGGKESVWMSSNSFPLFNVCKNKCAAFKSVKVLFFLCVRMAWVQQKHLKSTQSNIFFPLKCFNVQSREHFQGALLTSMPGKSIFNRLFLSHPSLVVVTSSDSFLSERQLLWCPLCPDSRSNYVLPKNIFSKRSILQHHCPQAFCGSSLAPEGQIVYEYMNIMNINFHDCE